MEKTFDLVIIGSGPGGYVAAIRAAQLGLKTGVIEKYQTLGGTCLNVGCIPSKALLQSTEHYEFLKKHGSLHGIQFENLNYNFSEMMERKREVVKNLTVGISQLFAKNKIEEIHGVASFVDAHTVEVNKTKIKAKNFILATGSKPVELPFLPFDEKVIVSSTGALALNQVPKKMIVIGAGVIGVELASVYRRLGSEVTIIEMLDRICPAMDAQISKTLLQIYKKQGLKFYLSAQVSSGKVVDNKCHLTFSFEGKELTESADIVLVAVGRKPNTKELQLENCGIETDKKGAVLVDDNFNTSQPHIFAIGDLIDGPMLAHKASEEGALVAELIAGVRRKINYVTIPNVIYTHPEVASVGFTEQEVKEMGLEPAIGIFQFRGNPRARCAADTDGFVKVVGDASSGYFLGLHIIGPSASEMIGEGVIALEKKMTLEELANSSHAHPTFSEAIKDAALAALKRPIHG